MQKLQPNKIAIHIVLALGGSLLILAGLFYATSNAGHNIDPVRLFELIKSSSLGYFLLYLITMILGLLVRAWRYRILLLASGETAVPSFSGMTLITAVRNMTVDLLPARMGEFVFVALLRNRAGTRVSAGLTTLLYAMMLDILVLAPITIIIGMMVGFPNKHQYLLAVIALAVASGFIVGVRYVLPILSIVFMRLSAVDNKLVSGLFRFVVAVDEAVQATYKAGQFSTLISITLLVRFLKYAGLLLLFYGLSGQAFPQIASLSVFQVLGSLIASEMTASLPIPALMSFGSWELGGMSLLAYFGAMPQNALLTMLGIHIQTQALDYGIGIIALTALFLFSSGGIRSRPRKSYKGIILFIFTSMVIALSWLGFDAFRNKHDSFQFLTQGKVMRPDSQPLAGWVEKLEGYIVWSSNRSGNHDIWIMSLPSMRIQQLTTHPHTENFAKISPDGTKVVFARSHKEWQSFRDDKPWDIWMIDIASGSETLLAKWGVSPSWSPDGRFVVFQRDPGQIIAVNIDSKKERLYYESGKDDFMKRRVNLNTPTIGSGQRMAFTYRNRGRPTNIIRDIDGQFHLVDTQSCQAQWTPEGDYVIYVHSSGKQGKQFMRFDPKTKKTNGFLDLPGEFSHEYFANLSQNQKFMVFAASSGGHEHDIADYELFIWPVGEDATQASRLTFNTNNDSWPDIYLH